MFITGFAGESTVWAPFCQRPYVTLPVRILMAAFGMLCSFDILLCKSVSTVESIYYILKKNTF